MTLEKSNKRIAALQYQIDRAAARKGTILTPQENPLPLHEWPTRVTNCLINAGILTWNELLEKSEIEGWLLSTPNMGPVSLSQINEKIKERKARS